MTPDRRGTTVATQGPSPRRMAGPLPTSAAQQARRAAHRPVRSIAGRDWRTPSPAAFPGRSRPPRRHVQHEDGPDNHGPPPGQPHLVGYDQDVQYGQGHPRREEIRVAEEAAGEDGVNWEVVGREEPDGCRLAGCTQQQQGCRRYEQGQPPTPRTAGAAEAIAGQDGKDGAGSDRTRPRWPATTRALSRCQDTGR